MDTKLGQIKRVFYEHPTKEFHIREIARSLEITKTTVAYHVNSLLEQEIILSRKRVFKTYYANESSKVYRFYKLIDGQIRIFESHLIEYLEKLNPKCIILFGSFAKAEYDINSDIDIFLQTYPQKVQLSRFERILKHKINILFENNLRKISAELLNNLINGINMYGYIRYEGDSELEKLRKRIHKESSKR